MLTLTTKYMQRRGTDMFKANNFLNLLDWSIK